MELAAALPNEFIDGEALEAATERPGLSRTVERTEKDLLTDPTPDARDSYPVSDGGGGALCSSGTAPLAPHDSGKSGKEGLRGETLVPAPDGTSSSAGAMEEEPPSPSPEPDQSAAASSLARWEKVVFPADGGRPETIYFDFRNNTRTTLSRAIMNSCETYNAADGRPGMPPQVCRIQVGPRRNVTQVAPGIGTA